MFEVFPSLQEDGYEITSPATVVYNCVAWAADDNGKWWEPDPIGICYWPKGVPREWTTDAVVAAFETLGYERCDNCDLEPHIEKVAIYADPSGVPTHVAWQMADGQWSSKLGQGVDITHATLRGLESPIYGMPCAYMKRQRTDRKSS